MCIALTTINGTATAPAYIANTCWRPSAANWSNGGTWSTGCFISVPDYSAGGRPSYGADSTTVVRVTLADSRTRRNGSSRPAGDPTTAGRHDHTGRELVARRHIGQTNSVAGGKKGLC